jgi:RecB family exonuclease
VSRFLYELDLDIGSNQDKKYEEVLYSFSDKKELPIYEDEFEVKYPLTPTSLKILLECPKRYYFSKVLNIFNESEDEDNFGSVLHEVLEEIVKNKTTIDSSKTYFETLMSGIFNKLNSKTDIYNIRVKFEDKLKKFCELDFENMRYIGHIVEEFLNVEFEGVRLTSRVDRIDIKTDEIVLIDYKTGNIDNILKHPYDFQLTFYYLWAKKNYPNKKITTVYWDIKNCELKEVSPKVDELKEVLKSLPNKVKMAEDIVVDEKVIKKASDICMWCEYNVACGR